MTTLYGIDSEGNIGEQFAQASKFVLRDGEDYSQTIKNDLGQPGAEELLAVCKKLEVDTVVAGDFGENVEKLFQENSIKMRKVDVNINEDVGKEELTIETIPQRIGRPFKVIGEAN